MGLDMKNNNNEPLLSMTNTITWTIGIRIILLFYIYKKTC
jgi:hypothetical protein